jgi:exopolysaccharide biosynthesis protein
MVEPLFTRNGLRIAQGKENVDFETHFNANWRKIDEQLVEKVFYDEISYEKYRDDTSNTTYFITHIPHLDKDGNIIKLKHGYQNDLMNSGTGETPRSFSNRHKASLVTNASIWNTSTGLLRGIQIQDGQIIQEHDGYSNYTLGIKPDNTLVMYPPTVSASEILVDGCLDAITAFYPMIENGVEVDSSVYSLIGNVNEQHPRNMIAQLPNKDIIYLTCNGRTSKDAGMAYSDCIRILLARGVQTAYMLDGGGSAQTVVRGVLVNPPLDGGGYEERKVGDFLYITRDVENLENTSVLSKDIGIVNKKVTDTSRDVLNLSDRLDGINGFENFDFPYIENLDNVDRTGMYWCLGSAIGSPDSAYSWGIIHFQTTSESGMQVAIPFHATAGSIMTRRTNPNTTLVSWYNWRAM